MLYIHAMEYSSRIRKGCTVDTHYNMNESSDYANWKLTGTKYCAFYGFPYMKHPEWVVL